MYRKEDVELICKNLTVHRSKFIFRLTNDSPWISSPKYLEDKRLSDTIYFPTYSLKGCLNSFNTKFFVIDIDGHNNESFDSLKIIYNNVVKILDNPSFVCKSPNGLHVYYLLQDYCNISILVSGVKKLLSQNIITKDLEIKPTAKVGLRLPNYNYILSNQLDYFFQIEKYEFGQFLEKCIHYPSFNFIYSQNEVVRKKTTYVEEETIKKGRTNEALNHYVPLWRGYGLSIDEIVDKFFDKLDTSYKGELRSKDKIRKRVQYYFKKDAYLYEAFKKDETDYESKYPHLFEAVINTYLTYAKTNEHNKKLRIESLKKDLTTILKIYDNNNLIKENKELLELHSYKNKYYKYEINRGCYPIPSSSDIKYNNLLFFKELGLLSLPYGRHYSTNTNSCIYYYININFIVIFKTNSKIIPCSCFRICFNMFGYRLKDKDIFHGPKSTGPPFLEIEKSKIA